MEINEKNKVLWDKNFENVTGDDNTFIRGENGELTKAVPLNNDPEIQEYGAITDILKYGYFEKDYKIYKVDYGIPKCIITGEYFKIYDVIGILDKWENFNIFAVFMGLTDDNTKIQFKYLYNDEIRNFKAVLKNEDVKILKEKKYTDNLITKLMTK
jgi:hypothetical protein